MGHQDGVLSHVSGQDYHRPSISRYLGTSTVPSVRTGWDSGISCSMEKLGQPCPTGFKTLIQIECICIAL